VYQTRHLQQKLPLFTSPLLKSVFEGSWTATGGQHAGKIHDQKDAHQEKTIHEDGRQVRQVLQCIGRDIESKKRARRHYGRRITRVVMGAASCLCIFS
jgi:isopentenyldiphosphate isomerase